MMITLFVSSQPCNQTSTLTAVPPMPVGGYSPGTSVTFCYTITNWAIVSSNWLHGVTPTFGTGWNIGSISTTPANTLSGTGNWSWYPSGQTGTSCSCFYGAGFYFETTSGGGVAGNPGDNYGDMGNEIGRAHV